MKSEGAVRACAEWLAFCLQIGWRRDQLEMLEALWWRYHDDRGQLQDETPEKTEAKL